MTDLLDLDVKNIIISHTSQPAGKDIFKGLEISEMIKASIKIAK